jgi:integrase/recombinase XerD
MTTTIEKVSKGDLEQRKLTDARFQGLALVPHEAEWFANLLNANTRRAYKNDVAEFMGFLGITKPEEFRGVTRSHIIA